MIMIVSGHDATMLERLNKENHLRNITTLSHLIYIMKNCPTRWKDGGGTAEWNRLISSVFNVLLSKMDGGNYTGLNKILLYCLFIVINFISTGNFDLKKRSYSKLIDRNGKILSPGWNEFPKSLTRC